MGSEARTDGRQARWQQHSLDRHQPVEELLAGAGLAEVDT